MKKLTANEVRETWINFWASKGHDILPSKSLIPFNDPSLLWINSGVATLKDYFSGKTIPKNPRITNYQKSIRTNDIENVGVTARHLTLFEMLGNFSIGEYFKTEVITWAYELLIDVFEIPQNKLYFTVYEEDQETYDAWIKLGIDPKHIFKGNKAMNFWDVGQGPCGPDTEIFFDRGPKYDPQNLGVKMLAEDLENDRYIEIWNIVFSQLNNEGNNNYTELSQKNIDTGMGFERMVSIFQDAPTNFDTDLFIPITKGIEKMTGNKYEVANYFTKEPKQQKINKHFRIIADHTRAITLAIQDGAKPSNTQRGYIIRRLLRRAYRSALLLGVQEESFLHNLVPVIAKTLAVYPIDLNRVASVIKQEELAFAQTIRHGEEMLAKELTNIKEEFPIEVAFKLFETYGFPIEITKEILDEKNIKIDISKFNKLKMQHVQASKGEMALGMESQIQIIQKIASLQSKFLGYDALKTKTKVIFQGQEQNKWYVLLEQTPFYPTGGGQACDKGKLNDEEVINVFKDKYGNIWHVLNNKLINDNLVMAQVGEDIRLQKERNHSATHLLGFALRQVFGDQVVQLGSDNNEARLRFDFPLENRPDKSKVQEVETMVNYLINQEIKREYIETTFDQAKEMGAITLENEVYTDNVRVVRFDQAIEFCGGTHIKNTQDIEAFKIISFESKGSGTFRIEAITSYQAISSYQKKEIQALQVVLKSLIAKNQKIDKTYTLVIPQTIAELKNAINLVKEDNKKFNKNKANLKLDLDVEFTKYENKKAYVNLNVKSQVVKPMTIQLREAHPDALIIIGAPSNNKITIAIASKTFNAKDIFDALAIKHNGKGGGNTDFMMGSMELFNLN